MCNGKRSKTDNIKIIRLENPEHMVISRDRLLKQRFCCGYGCTNCPYDPKHKQFANKIKVILQSENLK